MGPFDPERLADSYRQVTRLSNPSKYETTKAHDGYRQTQDLAPFGWVLGEFAPVRSAWLSVIEPGGYIVPHVDGGPYWERWQVPIHPSGRMVEDGRELTQLAGVPFRVRQWLTHEVVNDGDRDRVHLVIDRDLVAHPGNGRFTTEV